MIGANAIVVLAVVVEGALLGLYAVWALWRGQPVVPPCTARDAGLGLLAAVPLCAANWLLVQLIKRSSERFSGTREFVRQVVKPLADQLGPISALIVSIAAGLGEEFFFRATLLQEFGVAASSLLFSLMHFGPAVRRFLFLAGAYTLFGVYFAWIVSAFGSIWPAVISHAAYDFAALLYIRCCFSIPPGSR